MKVLFLARDAQDAPPGPTADWAANYPYEARVVVPLAGKSPTQPLLKVAVPRVRGEQVAAIYASRRRGNVLYQIAAPRRGRGEPPLTVDEQAIFIALAAVGLCRALAWTPDVLHVLDPAYGAGIYWLDTDGLRDEALGDVATVLSLDAAPGPWVGAARALSAYGLVPSDAPHLPDAARDALPALGIAHANGVILEGSLALVEAAALMLPTAPRAPVHARRPELDLTAWDPARDKAVARRYDAKHLARRAANKRALQQALKLDPGGGLLVAMLARDETAESLALALAALRGLLTKDKAAQVAIVGASAPAVEADLKALAKDFWGRVAVTARDSAPLVRRVYAGTDVFLGVARTASRGLPVRRAMCYGALPVVRLDGSEDDGVVDARHTRHGNSFVVQDYNAAAILAALQRARQAQARPARWQTLQRVGMHVGDLFKQMSKLAPAWAVHYYLPLYQLAISSRKEKREQLAGVLAEFPVEG